MTIAGVAREVVDKSVDDTSSSLAYSASGWLELFIGGLATLSCLVLVGIPVTLGYLHECLTGVMTGNERHPGFGNVRKIIRNGLRVSALGLEYGVITVVPFAVLLIIELFTLPGVMITRPGGAGDIVGYSIRYEGVTATSAIILLTTLALSYVFTTMFSNAWLRYALDGNMHSAMNPVSTFRWTLANPELLLSKMVSFGILGAVFAIPGLLIALLPGIDKTYWLPFLLYKIAYFWLVFAGLTANTFLRGRQIRGLIKDGKLKSVN